MSAGFTLDDFNQAFAKANSSDHQWPVPGEMDFAPACKAVNDKLAKQPSRTR